MKHLVVVRGGGELASGTIHALYRAGFRVLVLEKKEPSATRRRVAFSEAMYRGQAKVERITCYKAKNLIEAKDRLKKGELVMLEDPTARSVKELKPQVLVDAILSHSTNGTTKDMAEHTIALGPGFCAGRDVDVVVETMRGHNLGRLIYEGFSAPQSGYSEQHGGRKRQHGAFDFRPRSRHGGCAEHHFPDGQKRRTFGGAPYGRWP